MRRKYFSALIIKELYTHTRTYILIWKRINPKGKWEQLMNRHFIEKESHLAMIT